jgi:hypothetical protein
MIITHNNQKAMDSKRDKELIMRKRVCEISSQLEIVEYYHEHGDGYEGQQG